jgi:competence protein ComEA
VKDRPKSGAFLLIVIALLSIYLVKSYYISTPGPHTTTQPPSDKLESAGARLVFGLKLNINSATAAELALLPGIGEVIAERIVKARRVNGGFNSINELGRVHGLSPKRLRGLSPYITLEG